MVVPGLRCSDGRVLMLLNRLHVLVPVVVPGLWLLGACCCSSGVVVLVRSCERLLIFPVLPVVRVPPVFFVLVVILLFVCVFVLRCVWFSSQLFVFPLSFHFSVSCSFPFQWWSLFGFSFSWLCGVGFFDLVVVPVLFFSFSFSAWVVLLVVILHVGSRDFFCSARVVFVARVWRCF